MAFADETWDRIHYRQKQGHQNRSKRKRFYRISKRIEDLQRIDRRIGLIGEISAAIGGAVDEVLYAQIMSAGAIDECIVKSRAYGTMSRSEYILELMTEYGLLVDYDLAHADSIILIYTSSSATPIDYDSDARPIASQLKEYVRGYGLEAESVSSLVGTDDTESGEMALRILIVRNIGKYKTFDRCAIPFQTAHLRADLGDF